MTDFNMNYGCDIVDVFQNITNNCSEDISFAEDECKLVCIISVMKGNNSESDKKDWFKKELGSEVSEYYGDRLGFYQKIMDPKVFPMILEGIYKDYNRNLIK